jgi:hypothetical protein
MSGSYPAWSSKGYWNQFAIAFVLVGFLDVLLGNLLGTLRVIVGVHGFLILA